MRKDYYYVYGTTLTEEEAADILTKRLSIDFTPRESSYVGLYLDYQGSYADKLSIRPNFMPGGDWVIEQFNEYPIVITISHIDGKNVDKLKKSNFMRKIMSEIHEARLLKETIIESP